MFRVILYTQWKWSRLIVVLGSVAGFALPIISLQGAARPDASPLTPGDLLHTVQSWGVLYPVLAATLGLLVALATWAPDTRGRNYLGPVSRRQRCGSVSYRLGAGLDSLRAPSARALAGGLSAPGAAPIPLGFQGYPGG